MTLLQNLIAWGVYSIISFVLLLPFFGSIWQQISAALILGFLFGLLNRIAQELTNLTKEIGKNNFSRRFK